jgi:deoxyribonuclease V
MIACVDVDYRDDGAVAGCVTFHAWSDAQPAGKAVVRMDRVEPYEPGQFFRRELPCLLAVLEAIGTKPDVVLIDGYVWLGDEQHPGLGAHLHRALGGTIAVVGVAKTQFVGVRTVAEIFRGGSRSPLYVTAVGIDLSQAADHIRSMHGLYRIPTLLKCVDQLCRGRASE